MKNNSNKPMAHDHRIIPTEKYINHCVCVGYRAGPFIE
jgi:hypothetical protein